MQFRLRRITIVAMIMGAALSLLLSLVAAPAPASAATVFVNSDGLLVDAPLRVQSEDVGAALRDIRRFASDLRLDVGRLQSNLTATNAVVAAQQVELTATNGVVASQRSLIRQLRADLNETNAVAAAQQAELTATNAVVAAQRLELTEAQSLIAAQRVDLTAAHALIVGLQTNLTATNEIVAHHESLLLDQRSLIEGLRADLNATNEVAAAQQMIIAAQAASLTQAHAKIAEQRLLIINLQQFDTAANATFAAHADRLTGLDAQTAAIEAVDRTQFDDIGALQSLTANHSATLINVQAAAAALTDRVNATEAAATALTTRVGDVETATETLTGRVTSAELAAAALNTRVSAAEDAATTLSGRVTGAEDTIDTHSTQISALQAADTTITNNATTLRNRVTSAENAAATLNVTVSGHTVTLGTHSAQIGSLQTADTVITDAATTLANRVGAAEIATTALATRVQAAEDLSGTATTLATTVNGHSTTVATHTSQIATLQAADSTITSAANALSTRVGTAESRVTKAETLVVDSSTLVTTVLAHTANINALSLTVANFQSPTMYRYAFTTSGTWKVPAGVRSAFVTMAGGGGSGFGWRVSNAQQPGHSGGYVFSQPVSLVGGETLTITVGKGGVSYKPVIGGAVTGTPYFYQVAPAGDDGLGGYPGSHSAIVSPSKGEVLRCDGGSGASHGAISSYSGDPVPGNHVGQAGATIGSSSPTLPAPNRPAVGPYATPRGPGACGPDKFGIGNQGMLSYTVNSGDAAGGATPFGYGSGGSVGRSGCYITASGVTSSCLFPNPGRDGVVYIDVMY